VAGSCEYGDESSGSGATELEIIAKLRSWCQDLGKYLRQLFDVLYEYTEDRPVGLCYTESNVKESHLEVNGRVTN
jgi:hypothetical protein